MHSCAASPYKNDGAAITIALQLRNYRRLTLIICAIQWGGAASDQIDKVQEIFPRGDYKMQGVFLSRLIARMYNIVVVLSDIG